MRLLCIDISENKIPLEESINEMEHVSVVATFTRSSIIRPIPFELIIRRYYKEELISTKIWNQKLIAWKLGWENKNNIISENIKIENNFDSISCEIKSLIKNIDLNEIVSKIILCFSDTPYNQINVEQAIEKFSDIVFDPYDIYTEEYYKCYDGSRNCPNWLRLDIIGVESRKILSKRYLEDEETKELLDKFCENKDSESLCKELGVINTQYKEENLLENIYDNKIKNGYLDTSESEKDEDFVIETDKIIHNNKKKTFGKKNGKDIKNFPNINHKTRNIYSKNNEVPIYKENEDLETLSVNYSQLNEKNKNNNMITKIFLVVIFSGLLFFVYKKFIKKEDNENKKLEENK